MHGQIQRRAFCTLVTVFINIFDCYSLKIETPELRAPGSYPPKFNYAMVAAGVFLLAEPSIFTITVIRSKFVHAVYIQCHVDVASSTTKLGVFHFQRNQN